MHNSCFVLLLCFYRSSYYGDKGPYCVAGLGRSIVQEVISNDVHISCVDEEIAFTVKVTQRPVAVVEEFHTAAVLPGLFEPHCHGELTSATQPAVQVRNLEHVVSDKIEKTMTK